MDTDYDILEDKFNHNLEEKTMEIEQLDPQEMSEKETQMEFNELKRLEKQLKRVEKEKMTLLKKEYQSEKSLLLASGKRALDLNEMEAQYELKSRERERALTKLYGKLNSHIKE